MALGLGAAAAVGAGKPVEGAAATLAALEKNKQHAALAATPIARSRDALERAQGAADSGDARHAGMLRRLASEWAGVGRDLTRVNEAEIRADVVEKKLQEVETKLVRGRALLEETVARRGRATKKLEDLEKDPAAARTLGAAAPDATTQAPPKGASKKTKGATP